MSRKPVLLLKLGLDQCARTFGEGLCAATGTPCFYTFQTCKYPLATRANYFLRELSYHRFCLNQGPQLAAAAPLLEDIQDQEAEIRPGENITQVGNYKVKCLDCAPRYWANPDKPLDPDKQNPETAGTFWKNLWARHSDDYYHRPVEIWRGYWGEPEESWSLYFRGAIEEWNLTEEGAELVCRDHLIKLKVEAPLKQGSDNVLTQNYAGGTDLYVTAAIEFHEPTELNGRALVRIEDDTIPEPCYVSYTVRDVANNRLRNCSPGRFGSPAVGHAAGCKVSNVLILADDTAEPGAGWAGVEGLPLDRYLLEILCNQAGIPINDIRWLDRNVQLAAQLSANGKTLALSDSSRLPHSGVIRVEDEAIIYTDKTTATGYDVVDGEAGPQDDEDLVCDRYSSGWRFIKFETGPDDTALSRFWLYLKRAGALLQGSIHLYLYSDDAGEPDAQLAELGSEALSRIGKDTYAAPLLFNHYVGVNSSTTYWLAYYCEVTGGGGPLSKIWQALRADPIETEFMGGFPGSSYYGIAGYPLFRVEKLAGAAAGLSILQRGAYGTAAVVHNAGTPVFLAEASSETERWWPAGRFKRIIEDSTKLFELVKDLRASTMSEVWPDPDGTIRISAAPSPFSLDPLRELTDNLHLLDDKPELQNKTKDRKTRIYIYYNPVEASAGEDPEKFSLYSYWDVRLESEEQLDEKLVHKLFCKCLYRPEDAANLAAHQFIRYRWGAPVFSFSLSDEEAVNWPLGAFILVTSDQVVRADGLPRSQVMYRVTKRKDLGGAWRYFAADISGGKEGMPYRCIAPTVVGANLYDDASADDRRLYCYISDGGSPTAEGTLGAAEDPPHRIL